MCGVSVRYICISAFLAFSSAVKYAVNLLTRALNKPNMLLVISLVKFAVNIILDLILILKFYIRGIIPTVNM